MNFYSFAANLNSMGTILMILHQSCALTLALKYKLRTKRQVFKRFGRYLEDPGSEMRLYLPVNLKVLHKYAGTSEKKKKKQTGREHS